MLWRLRSGGVVSNMMAASSRAQVMSLYRCLLRESSKFASYNYRTYALRRVRDAFRAHRTEDNPRTVQRLMEEGRQALGVIQRQVAIGQMYSAQKTVVE